MGNPQVARDFSDVRDVVRGYGLLLERGCAGEVYQVCSGCAVPVGSIIEKLIARAGVPIELRIDPAKARRGESQELWGDNCKIRSQTGWSPQYTLEETLDSVLNYWQEQVAIGPSHSHQAERQARR